MTKQDKCIFCNQVLPEIKDAKYCPFCGMMIETASDKGVVERVPPEDLQQEKPLLENKKSLLDLQNATRGKYEKIAQEQKVKFLTPEEKYTLILKGCEDKQLLLECLNQLLLRGETAVKLAIISMPSMLLYKVNKQSVDTIASALKDFDAVYSIIEGDFDLSGFYKSECFKNLSPASRAFLKAIDKTMWIGENVVFITDNMIFEGQEGYGVLSENAFFFFAKGDKEKNCFLPIYKLESFDLWENNGRYLGEWITAYGRSYQMEFSNWQDYNAIKEIAENINIS